MYNRIYKRSLMAEDRDLLIFNLKYVILLLLRINYTVCCFFTHITILTLHGL